MSYYDVIRCNICGTMLNNVQAYQEHVNTQHWHGGYGPVSLRDKKKQNVRNRKGLRA